MNNLWQDLRYASRMLIKKPGFTLIAVMTLALAMPAQAQYYAPSVYNNIHNPIGLTFQQPMVLPNSYGYNYGSNYGYGYGYGYGYSRPHFDYVPTQIIPHYNHYHVQPAHLDYHIGGRYYQAVPGAFGSVYISPYPHRHR